MSATSIAPKLPGELLLSATLSHLRRHDLAQVCKANSYPRSIARPLFYQFCALTKFGLYFPGASIPYPFLDVPEAGVTELDASTRGHLVFRIKKIASLPHTPSECAIFRTLQLDQSPNAVEFD